MKAKILSIFLMLLTCNSYAQSECRHEEQAKDLRAQEEAKRIELQKEILRLYQSGVLRFSKDGKLQITEDGESLIEELKEKGIFEQIDVSDYKIICM